MDETDITDIGHVYGMDVIELESHDIPVTSTSNDDVTIPKNVTSAHEETDVISSGFYDHGFEFPIITKLNEPDYYNNYTDLIYENMPSSKLPEDYLFPLDINGTPPISNIVDLPGTSIHTEFVRKETLNGSSSPICLLYMTHTSDPLLELSFKISATLIFIISVCGISFNFLGILVLMSARIKRTSTSLYLLVLAISDTCYLLAILLSRGLEGLKCLFFPNSNLDIYHQYDFTCKGLQYMLDLFADFSGCIILSFTVERFIACYFAVIYKRKCGFKKAAVGLLVLFFCIAITTLPHHMLFTAIKHDGTKSICIVSRKYAVPFTYMYITETSIYRIIPTYLVAVFNVSIIYKLWQLHKTKEERRPKVKVTKVKVTHRSSLDVVKNSDNSVSSVAKADKANNNKISLLLVLISSFYLICYQPMIICYVIRRVKKYSYVNTPRNLIIFRNFSRVLHMLGFALNFFFYVLASHVFRHELKRKFCKPYKKAKVMVSKV